MRLQHSLIAAIGLLSAAVLVGQIPKKPLADYYSYSTAIYARHGELLRLSLAADQQYRVWVPLAAIPKSLQQGTLLYEDRWFYWHLGVNPLALLRSAWMSYGRGAHQGGSTISMQVARQLYHINSRHPAGKLWQIAAAVWLELRYSKAEILESYLNTAPYGGNIVGVAAASLLYFHKPVAQLTLTEALTLAVIPQNPKQRCPKPQGLSSGLRQARLRLWQRWQAQFPHDQRFAADFALPLSIHSKADKPFIAPHLTDLLLRQSTPQSSVYSSLDLAAQLASKQTVSDYLQQNHTLGLRNAAVLLVDSRDMQVRALIGSSDYWDKRIKGQVNGTQAKRSPGSTLKPFIYGLALDQGLLHPRTLVADTPTAFGTYNPENFDNRFMGPITAQEALIRSRNIPALNLAAKLKNPPLYRFLQQAGIKGLRAEAHYGLSLALGGGEVSMVELAQLYAMLVNQGRLQPLRYQLPQAPNPSNTSLLSPASSYITLAMLSANPRPDSQRPAVPKVAWKTGTSWGFKDAWAAGVVGHYVLVVWVGDFDNHSHTAFTGVKAAGALFFSLLDRLRHQQLLDGLAYDFLSRKPKNVSQVTVCKASGDLPNEDCPELEKTLFIPGVSPIKTSTLHQAVYFNSEGKVVCKDQPYRRRGVYEFWPTEMASLFSQAGLPRRTPPDLPSCYTQNSDNSVLEIVSPSSIGVYTLAIGKSAGIGLKAKSQSNSDIFWFANKSFIGKAKALETLSWIPEHPGTYLIRASDDQGHSVAKSLKVAFIP